MEILLGMLLLMQVLVSIQIMLSYRRVLQQLEKLESRINKLPETIDRKEIRGASGLNEVDGLEENNELNLLLDKKAEYGIVKKEAQEALINEVLSEVF